MIDGIVKDLTPIIEKA